MLGCASTADFLPRGDDLAELRHLVTAQRSDRGGAVLPALVELDVSGCPVNRDVMDLVVPLAACKSLAKVAASNAHLSGDLLDLTDLAVEIDGKSHSSVTAPLAGALQVLDLSGNLIHQVTAVNAHSVLSLADNGQAVEMPHGTLRKALEDGVRLDLTNVALVDDSEAKELIAKGSLNITEIYDDSCQCEPQKALHSDQCVDCHDLKLDRGGIRRRYALQDCENPGSLATKAPPTLGHACLDPAEEQCNASANGSELGCALGYEGPLCAICADRYRSQGRRCKKCEEGYEAARWPLALAAATAAAGGCAFFVWWRSRTADVPAEAIPALWPLLLAQGPVLLQFLQLWGVLVALSKKSTGETTAQTWDQEYVQWLQLTAGGLRDALSLECEYGRNARLACAVLGPVLPLLLLAACAILEAVLRGRGVSVALQVLSLAFIGGASSCAGLLRCQELDGGGEPLGEEHAFRSLLPHLKCSEAPWVAAIGWGCAVGYGIFVPACMANSEESKEMSSRVQLAGAVAYCAVFFRGSVQIKSADGCLQLGTADNILSMALDNKADADLQRWQAVTRMLKERCIIEEAAPSDRCLAELA
ncbi:inlA [Symbiodinium sp. CCMP2456]|nr:inlA [Symbiodinium sp. CCMP2456]